MNPVKSTLFLVAAIEGYILMASELIFSKQIAPVLGDTTFIWAGVLSAVVCGLALGYYFGGLLSRGTQVEKYFLIILFLVSIFSFISFVTLSNYGIFYAQFSIGLGTLIICLIHVIPLAVLLGLLSPVLIQMLQVYSDIGKAAVGRIYFISTFGGVLAIFINGFYILPVLGIDMAVLIVLLLSILIFIMSLVVLKTRKPILLVLLFTCLLWSSCEKETPINEFVLTGEIQNSDPSELYLSEILFGLNLRFDTIQIGQDGKFRSEIDVGNGKRIYLLSAPKRKNYPIFFVAENGKELDINTYWDDFGNYSFNKPNDENHKIYSFFQKLNEHLGEHKNIERILNSIMNEKGMNGYYDTLGISVEKRYDEIYFSKKDFIKSTILNEQEEIIKFFATTFLSADEDHFFIKHLSGLLETKLDTFLLSNLEKALDIETNQLPEYPLNYIQGPNQNEEFKEAFVDNQKPKILVVWSSWCHEAMIELEAILKHPNYNEWDLITVSIDVQKEAWKQKLKEFNDFKDLNFCSGKGWNSTEVKFLRLEVSPSIYVLNPKGQVQYINPRGNELLSIMDEIN